MLVLPITLEGVAPTTLAKHQWFTPQSDLPVVLCSMPVTLLLSECFLASSLSKLLLPVVPVETGLRIALSLGARGSAAILDLWVTVFLAPMLHPRRKGVILGIGAP